VRLALLAGIALCLLGLGVSYAQRNAAGREERPAVTGAAAVVERFQCYRCHDAPGKLVPAVSRKHCVHCHQEILAGDRDGEFEPAVTAGWKERIHSLVLVPSLTGADRFRRDWFVAFLRNPHELRPDLGASMPRLRVTPSDAEAIADYFFPAIAPEPPLTLGDPERGRALFVANSCGQCHRFTGAAVEERVLTKEPVVRLAPDLRHARERLSARSLVAWLRDPAAVKADAAMPRIPMTDEQILDVAAFVLETKLGPAPTRPLPERLPLLARLVAWEEVSKRVFKRTCWHCHSDPAPVGGDGGPGNTGGFGFAGVGLDFGTADAIRRGGHKAGVLLDVLGRDDSGTPYLITALMARHVEVAGGEVPGVLGMPLGLPPVSPEDIQLVETWIAQGAKGPG
jgi:mono/diheme cytochrome c family protein